MPAACLAGTASLSSITKDLFEGRLDLLHGAAYVFFGVEGRKSDISLAALAKPRPRRADHSGPIEQHIEKLPGILFTLYPDIG